MGDGTDSTPSIGSDGQYAFRTPYTQPHSIRVVMLPGGNGEGNRLHQGCRREVRIVELRGSHIYKGLRNSLYRSEWLAPLFINRSSVSDPTVNIVDSDPDI